MQIAYRDENGNVKTDEVLEVCDKLIQEAADTRQLNHERELFRLMNDTPRTRSQDPSTSHEAEAFIRKGGKLAAQHRQVLHVLANYPGRTAREYDDSGYLGTSGIFHRRLGELLKRGKVRRGEVKRDRGGRNAHTWFLVEQKP